MKTVIKALVILLINLALVYGYGGQPPSPPQFVSSEIEGPPHLAPLFLVDTNSVTIFSQLSFYSPSSIDGMITVEGTGSVSPANPDSKNLDWKIPAAAFGAGVSFNLGESQELFATLKIDKRENGISFSGADFGLSFLISRKNNIRARLDFGLSYVPMDMEALVLETDNYYIDSLYVTKTENGNGLGPFASLTIQSAFDNWIINPYLQASYCRLPLFNIDNYSREIFCSINVFSLTPGITYKLSNNILLVAGGSYFIPSGIENKSSPGIYSGFVQANFLF